ncbi:helix-turn-helix domain-containing protein [Aequorivita viscosa]|nr:helix-turn-helix domain-containing protein [Aequorivita viscosa]
MLLEAQNALYYQPKESLKIAEHLIENSDNTRLRIDAYMLAAASHHTMGNFNNAIKAYLEAKKLAEASEDIEMRIKVSTSSFHLMNQLGMNVVAEQYYLRTKAVAANTNSILISKYLNGAAALINASKKTETGDDSEVLKSLQQANTSFKKIPDPKLINETSASIIEAYLAAKPIDSAEVFFKTILQNSMGEDPNTFIRMVTLNQLGKVYFLKKEYQQSLTSYQTALEISKQLSNKAYQSEIMEGLATTFLALNKASLFYTNRAESGQVANEVETEEEKAINTIYNYINDNFNARGEEVKEVFKRNVIILCSILFLILLTYFVLKYRYQYRAKQYERFLGYFENIKPKEKPFKKEVSKSLNIPKETEAALVQKLIQFENSKHYTKQDMSLAALASHFDTNTKYLSEIINSHKNKNFNSYINELRINYIIDKLKNNSTYLNYKISYLAEESGFSSHSSFATVFKAVTGISPTVFIDLLKTKKTAAKAYAKQYEATE